MSIYHPRLRVNYQCVFSLLLEYVLCVLLITLLCSDHQHLVLLSVQSQIEEPRQVGHRYRGLKLKEVDVEVVQFICL